MHCKPAADSRDAPKRSDRLLKVAQFFEHVLHRWSVGRVLSDVSPADHPFTIKNEQRGPGDPLLRMQYVVRDDASPRRVRQDWKRDSELGDGHARLLGPIRAQGNDFSVAPSLVGRPRSLACRRDDRFVARLQLTELPLTVPSRVHPIEHQENVLLTFEGAQIDCAALNRLT